MIRIYIQSVVCHGSRLRPGNSNSGKGLFVIIHTLVLVSLASIFYDSLGKNLFALLPLVFIFFLQKVVGKIEEINCEELNQNARKWSVFGMYCLLILSVLVVLLFNT